MNKNKTGDFKCVILNTFNNTLNFIIMALRLFFNMKLTVSLPPENFIHNEKYVF
jgi:hypothetical protein